MLKKAAVNGINCRFLKQPYFVSSLLGNNGSIYHIKVELVYMEELCSNCSVFVKLKMYFNMVQSGRFVSFHLSKYSSCNKPAQPAPTLFGVFIVLLIS